MNDDSFNVIFDGWRQHPVTVALMAQLGEKREELKARWESGTFTSYTQEGTVIANVANMGLCQAYAYIMEIEADDLREKANAK